jgi:hypothetical protein
MKVGFNKNGLSINSKKFDPLNLSVRGFGIESDNEPNQIDTFEVLSILASAREEGASRLDQITALQNAYKIVDKK